MNKLTAGVKAAFEVTYDQAGLNVGMTVVDVTGANPVNLGVLPCQLIANFTYAGYFTPVADKTYVINLAVYTDNTFTTIDTNFAQGSESFYAEGSTDLSQVTLQLLAVAQGFAGAEAKELEICTPTLELEMVDEGN